MLRNSFDSQGLSKCSDTCLETGSCIHVQTISQATWTIRLSESTRIHSLFAPSSGLMLYRLSYPITHSPFGCYFPTALNEFYFYPRHYNNNSTCSFAGDTSLNVCRHRLWSIRALNYIPSISKSVYPSLSLRSISPIFRETCFKSQEKFYQRTIVHPKIYIFPPTFLMTIVLLVLDH